MDQVMRRVEFEAVRVHTRGKAAAMRLRVTLVFRNHRKRMEIVDLDPQAHWNPIPQAFAYEN